MRLQEYFVSRARKFPSVILDKLIVGTKIHGKRFPALRTFRDQLGRDPHILLLLVHFLNHLFVIVGVLRTGFRALEKTVIPLGIKEPFLIESRLLEAVIHVRRQDEIILVFHQREEIVIHRFRRIQIAVDVDVSGPVRPHDLRLHSQHMKAAGIHVRKTVLFREVGKVCREPLTAIDKARRSGKACTGTDHDSIRFRESLLQFFIHYDHLDSEGSDKTEDQYP